jgi:hypothetical protein
VQIGVCRGRGECEKVRVGLRLKKKKKNLVLYFSLYKLRGYSSLCPSFLVSLTLLLQWFFLS